MQGLREKRAGERNWGGWGERTRQLEASRLEKNGWHAVLAKDLREARAPSLFEPPWCL